MTLPFPSLLARCLLAVVAACGSSSTNLSMSVRTGTASATSSQSRALSGGGGVILTHVRMVIEEIKLEPAGSSSDAGVDGGTSREDVIAGPYLIDLSGAALETGLTQVFNVDAAPGTYEEIRFKIHKLSGGDPQFAGMAGLSINLDGTFNGTTFNWTSSLDEEQRKEGIFVVQDGSSNNLTLAIDTTKWFVDRNGAPIDPRDESKRSIVEDNIKSSIDAFDDDDHNGRR